MSQIESLQPHKDNGKETEKRKLSPQEEEEALNAAMRRYHEEWKEGASHFDKIVFLNELNAAIQQSESPIRLGIDNGRMVIHYNGSSLDPEKKSTASSPTEVEKQPENLHIQNKKVEHLKGPRALLSEGALERLRLLDVERKRRRAELAEFLVRDGEGQKRNIELSQKYREETRKIDQQLFEEDLRREENVILEEIASEVWTSEERKEKVQRLKSVIEIQQYYRDYLSAYDRSVPSEAHRDEIRTKAIIDLQFDFSPEERERILSATKRGAGRYRNIVENQLMMAVLAQDPSAYDRISAILQDANLSSEQKTRSIHGIIEDVADSQIRKSRGEITVYEALETWQTVNQQVSNHAEIEGVPADVTTGVEGQAEGENAALNRNLSHLDQQEREVVMELVRQGCTDIAIFVLSSENASVRSDGIAAQIEGEKVIAIVKGDRPQAYIESVDGKKIQIPLTHPPAAGFDLARSKKISGAAHALISENWSRTLDEQFVKHLGGIDLRDSAFMKRQEAFTWQRILDVMLRNTSSAEEEVRVLRELGILAVNRNLNIQRAAWFRLFWRFLAARGELPSVRRSDLLTIAKRWDVEGNPSFPSLRELRTIK